MLIDCDTCTARPRACGDCIVTYLLAAEPPASHDRPAAPVTRSGDLLAGDPRAAGAVGPGGRGAELTDSEMAAVGVLAAGGLVPPLRLASAARPQRHGRAGGSRAG